MKRQEGVSGDERTDARDSMSDTMNGEESRVRGPKPLGPLERQVLEILWDHGARSVRQVIDLLPTDPAYTTIATVLSNLKRKRYVRTRRDGRSSLYEPLFSRADHDAAVMGGVLAASRDRSATILRFADSMSAEDIGLLKDYLRRQESGGHGNDAQEAGGQEHDPVESGDGTPSAHKPVSHELGSHELGSHEPGQGR